MKNQINVIRNAIEYLVGEAAFNVKAGRGNPRYVGTIRAKEGNDPDVRREMSRFVKDWWLHSLCPPRNRLHWKGRLGENNPNAVIYKVHNWRPNCRNIKREHAQFFDIYLYVDYDFERKHNRRGSF